MELTEAKRLAAEAGSPVGVEWIGVERASGRVLADAIEARVDLPRESRSRLDGFALVSSDTLNASSHDPVVLRVQPGLLAAGYMPDREMRSGECARILTGAPLPPYADAVAPREEASLEGERLILKCAYAPGHGLVPRGEEVREGELLLSRGDLLTPTRLALVAALGHATIPVYRRPRVAVLATGDEVRELGEALQGPWTFCNNRHLLAWLAEIHGGEPIHLGVAGDDPTAIAERLERAEADLVISTGGMGRGERDFLLQAWTLLGIRTCFHEINLSPGKNSAMGVRERQTFFGLPGSPWAAQVVFVELALPVLRKYQGLKTLNNPHIVAVLESPVKKIPGVHKAVRGVLRMQRVPATFMPFRGRGESLFSTLKNSPAYALLESDTSEAPAGAQVLVRLHDSPLPASCFSAMTGT